MIYFIRDTEIPPIQCLVLEVLKKQRGAWLDIADVYRIVVDPQWTRGDGITNYWLDSLYRVLVSLDEAGLAERSSPFPDEALWRAIPK